ncbi:glycosyltransferase [Frigidibacter oleivorans]|uniref:glycosyltransferase n=1 Tax=Frigidibacter oleivorans TaxID=2487129 RepID=UPI0013E00F6E|nr:glycosyltransferase [Frigidibacter oleivorans]
MDPYFRSERPVKHAAKQAFWLLWQGRMLSNAHAVLFTCKEEKRLARGTFFGHADYRERVVAFCAADQATSAAPGLDAFRAAHPVLQDRDYLLFVGRIHPKKAYDQLITVFATVADLDPGIDLVIAGPDQTGWVPALKAQAETLGIGNRVHWPGMIGGDVKQAACANARAFVLPSHQENFGIVVAEALSAGTPVLISNKVNIWREIESDGAGLVAPDTVEDTSDMLRRFLTMPAEAAPDMRLAARRCYDEHLMRRNAET